MSTNIERCSIIVLSVMYMNMFVTAVVSGERTVVSQWEDGRHLSDGAIWSLLVKKNGYGNSGPEWLHWEGKPLEDSTRKSALEKLLAQYPSSEYADDAALLLARAKLFYDNDPVGAVEELYQVIKDYPNGEWIAEDQIWLFIMPSMVKFDTEGEVELKYPYKGAIDDVCSKYLIYLESHPHLTVDEARYWIAFIILKTDLRESRYLEAIQILQEVINKYKQPQFKRGTQENELWNSVKNRSYDRMMRVEMRCYYLLVSASFEQRDYARVVEAGEECLAVNKQKELNFYMHSRLGDAYAELQQWGKAALHYEELFNDDLADLKGEARLKYQEKLRAVRQKMR